MIEYDEKAGKVTETNWWSVVDIQDEYYNQKEYYKDTPESLPDSVTWKILKEVAEFAEQSYCPITQDIIETSVMDYMDENYERV